MIAPFICVTCLFFGRYFHFQFLHTLTSILFQSFINVIVIMDYFSLLHLIGAYFLFHFIFYGSLLQKCAFSWSIFQVCACARVCVCTYFYGVYRIANRENVVACQVLLLRFRFCFLALLPFFPNHLCQHSLWLSNNPFLMKYLCVAKKIMHIFLESWRFTTHTLHVCLSHRMNEQQQCEFIALFSRSISIKIY